MTTATVKLWGTTIGYIAMDRGERFARFEYAPDFEGFGIEPAPLMMPVQSRRIYQFPDLHPRSFHGMPGLIADSLPDKYGQRLIDVWLAQTGRNPADFNGVDRLCYTGTRGMGALEFEPSAGPDKTEGKLLAIEDLTELASMAFASKEALNARFTEAGSSELGDKEALLDILKVGTSAGGARAKAVIAFNPQTKQVRSGQLHLPKGFEHWLIKFDGVKFSGDWGVADPSGYGLLEYSYHLMAKECGINMMESRLLSENGRDHFMTRRFDRDGEGDKKLVQTFAALAHYDYYESGYYSYEQLFMAMKRLDIPKPAFEEQFRRVVFNIVGCNQDDHVKNFAFMMDRKGKWDLSPAYDLCHSEGSEFTRNHQLSINGKTNDFDRGDLKHLAQYAGLPRGSEKQIIQRTVEAFSTWQAIATDLSIPAKLQKHVLGTLRLKI
jgi:serine/threonine-protein kinase HipA